MSEHHGDIQAEPLSKLFGEEASGRPKPKAKRRKRQRDVVLHPVSLRMTFEEKANLEKAAAGMSVAAYIRWRLFDPKSPPPKRRATMPIKDHKLLAKLLALLGHSRMANNINQLARAANTGSLPLTPETENALVVAAREIQLMRDLLIQALNVDVMP